MTHLPALLALLLLLVIAACSGKPEPAGAFETGGAAVVPLLRVHPGEAGPSPDLDALGRWLGDASLVGLGENPHGVHEFHRLAHRILAHSQSAAEPDRPFGVYALEIDQAHAAHLNDYVQGRRDDLDTVMAEGWWGSKIFYDRAPPRPAPLDAQPEP